MRAFRASFTCAATALLFAASAAVAQVLAPLGPLDATGQVSYFIAPPADDAGARPGDEDLALWALESWERAAGGALKFVRAANENDALVRLYWVPAAGGQYGEMRALNIHGLRGAAVYIRPDTTALGDEIAAAARLDSVELARGAMSDSSPMPSRASWRRVAFIRVCSK